MLCYLLLYFWLGHVSSAISSSTFHIPALPGRSWGLVSLQQHVAYLHPLVDFHVHVSTLSPRQCPTLCTSRCPYRGLSAAITVGALGGSAAGPAVRSGACVTGSSVAANKGIHHTAQEPWQESPHHAIVPQIWTYHLITLPCHLIALSRCRLVKRRDLSPLSSPDPQPPHHDNCSSHQVISCPRVPPNEIQFQPAAFLSCLSFF